MIMELQNFFKNGKVYVWRENFAVAKAKRSLDGAFAIIRDKNETTVVIEQNKVRDEDVYEIERDWKIMTFDMVLPFSLVGFMAKISQVLADQGISIFALSAYSTDHILVKAKDLSSAIRKIESLGCVVEKK